MLNIFSLRSAFRRPWPSRRPRSLGDVRMDERLQRGQARDRDPDLVDHRNAGHELALTGDQGEDLTRPPALTSLVVPDGLKVGQIVTHPLAQASGRCCRGRPRVCGNGSTSRVCGQPLIVLTHVFQSRAKIRRPAGSTGRVVVRSRWSMYLSITASSTAAGSTPVAEQYRRTGSSRYRVLGSLSCSANFFQAGDNAGPCCRTPFSFAN